MSVGLPAYLASRILRSVLKKLYDYLGTVLPEIFNYRSSITSLENFRKKSMIYYRDEEDTSMLPCMPKSDYFSKFKKFY